MSIQQQVHNKFKVFVGASMGEVNDQVRSFTQDGQVAAKSIGIEFVEATNQFLLSLGYAEGQDGYAVVITDSVAGPLPTSNDTDKLGDALEAAAEHAGDVICHELYVDAGSVVHMVFMTKV